MRNIWQLFWCFHKIGCSILLNPFAVSGFSRPKFRVPTRGSLEELENELFYGCTPVGGPSKHIFEKNQKSFFDPYSIHWQKNHLLSNSWNFLGIWHTLRYDNYKRATRIYIFFLFGKPLSKGGVGKWVQGPDGLEALKKIHKNIGTCL